MKKAVFILFLLAAPAWGQDWHMGIFENASTNGMYVQAWVNGFTASNEYVIPPGHTIRVLNVSSVTWTPVSSVDWTGAYGGGAAPADPSSNLWVVATGPSVDTGSLDRFGNKVFFGQIVYSYEPAPVQTPPLTECVQYWIWGICVALVLGLSGAMRRMLGRVHEVNTDL